MTSLQRWQAENQRYLQLAIDALLSRGEVERAAADAFAAEMESPPALLQLAQSFGLDRFETEVLLRCVAVELDRRFDEEATTIAGLLDGAPGARWSAFDPGGPLLRWELVEPFQPSPFAHVPLRAAPDALASILGMSVRSPLAGLIQPAPSAQGNLTRYVQAAQRLAGAIVGAASAHGRIPAVELHGADWEDRAAVAALIAQRLGANLEEVDARDLPNARHELTPLILRWDRYTRLTRTHLLITVEDDDDAVSVVRRVLATVGGPVFISARRPVIRGLRRAVLRHELTELGVQEREELWWASLRPCLERLGLTPDTAITSGVELLASQFHLGAQTIATVCAEAEAGAADMPAGHAGAVMAALRAGCHRAVRARLDPVAERVPIDPAAALELPPRERASLDEIVAQIRLSHVVNERGGFGRGGRREVVALFSGPSGTGKTHAAMIVAREADLDLYRVRVSDILSKWIGETEQNLERLFDAAAIGGAVMLFDEADALFGKRSEVRDSHDRYANLSTAYLLQRIDRSPVPTILTTNLSSALDPAFLRRLHVVVEFPFPGEQVRAQIWRSAFATGTKTEGLVPERLASLAVAGGTIESIARRAAFLAAAEDQPVAMTHVREGAARQARQSGRELTGEEVEGW